MLNYAYCSDTSFAASSITGDCPSGAASLGINHEPDKPARVVPGARPGSESRNQPQQ